MSGITLENAVERLEAAVKRIDELEFELARQKAVTECQNLLGRYAFWHSANMHKEKKILFAEEHEDFRCEINASYVGENGFDRYVTGHSFMGEEYNKGTIRMHALTTPVIEVAKDGKSARGVWICPGYETSKRGPVGEENFRCDWAWMKYGCDFILTDAGWKILHLHVYGLFMCDYYTAWADTPLAKGEDPMVMGEITEEMLANMSEDDKYFMRMMKENGPNAPATHPVWAYKRDAPPENYPAPPEPYDTWTDIKETY